MNSSLESIPVNSYALVPDETPSAPDPDRPSWSVLTALLVWLSSVLLLFFLQLVIVFGYFAARGIMSGSGILQPTKADEPTLLLLSVVATLPSHLLTLFLVWAVVTRRGKDSFGAAIGLRWDEASRFWTRARGLWTCAGIAIAMYVCGGLLVALFPGGKTVVDQLVASSDAARLMIAFIATFTAPLVEELIYRGVLYSAFRKWVGKLYTVIFVSLMFAVVHVPQYYSNIAIVVAITILSVVLTTVRARTNRLLPCFFIHMIFNGLQAAILIVAPYLPTSVSDPDGAPNVTSSIIFAMIDRLKFF